MLEGKITNSIILSNDTTGETTLMGVAQYFDNKVNFKVPYDWESLDVDWFLKELRDTLARDLDITVKQMDIGEHALIHKMKQYHIWNKKG